jgi:hypothetical protein
VRSPFETSPGNKVSETLSQQKRWSVVILSVIQLWGGIGQPLQKHEVQSKN